MAMSTQEDHDRVHAIPAYRRFYEARDHWMWRWAHNRRAQAERKKDKARAKLEAELRRIDEWCYGPERRIDDLAYEAWQAENDKRYWKLRKV